MKTILGWLLALGVLAAGIYFGADYLPAKEELFAQEEEDQIQTVAVERRSIEATVVSSGDISPREQVAVKPEISSRIKSILIEPGQRIKKGQLLMELDDNELLTDKASAEAEIEGSEILKEKAQRNFARAQLLFQRKLISREEFENLRSDRDKAANDYEQRVRRIETVKEKLRKTRIVSPMEGVVLSVPVVEGQVVTGAGSVNAGTTLSEIADLSRMFISTHLNQVDVTRVHPEQEVYVGIDSLRGVSMRGKVRHISPMASILRNVKGFTVEVNIVELDPRVRPGMTADLTFPVDSRDDTLALPLSAIFTEDDDSKVVYVSYDSDAPPKKLLVEVGISDYNFAEIRSGLKEGQRVLLAKPDDSREG